ncbi:hypothetical protein [Kitasatospora sp. NPDC004531]
MAVVLAMAAVVLGGTACAADRKPTRQPVRQPAAPQTVPTASAPSPVGTPSFAYSPSPSASAVFTTAPAAPRATQTPTVHPPTVTVTPDTHADDGNHGPTRRSTRPGGPTRRSR